MAVVENVQVGLPEGTVTFLFTDIEGSTLGMAAVGDARWAELLGVHRELLREAFSRHGGAEVATEGDAFFVAFARAADAAGAALAGVRALESHPWPEGRPIRVRMGLHSGEALVVEEDYVGHDVHRAKRICDAGHGGQIVVSEATATLVRPHLPDGARLVDLGAHRLKDLGDAQRLFQLAAEGLPADFPPLRSLDSFAHTLPAQRTSFVGREAEIAEVRKLLDRSRLVTLTGVGGAGKTRLAVQVAAELLDDYPDGVYFVDLAPLSQGSLLVGAVAAGVGIAMGADVGSGAVGSAEDFVLGHLGARRCLVVLDNCEHLLDDAAGLAERILDCCSEVSLLVTSRESLGVEGEQSWRVPSLSLGSGDDAAGSEAARLFAARARAVRPEFDIGAANAAAVGEICRRLDGMPLAIELAAARVAHLQPEQISERLDDMFRLLTGGRRRVQRQQTLQATLDWSHELLSGPEQALLRRLAVFAGSFSLAAAEGICTGEPITPTEVLDLLGSLVAKSLVATVEEGVATRYRLIETVRAYASEKLRQAGEADALRSAHRDFYEAWVRSFPWADLLVGPRFSRSFGRDQANFRAALEWSEAEQRPDRVVALAARLHYLWSGLGHVEEGYRWLTIARPEDLDLSSEERTAALASAAFLAILLADPAGFELADRAVEAAGGHPGVPLVVALTRRAANRAIRSGRDDELAAAARADIDAASQLARNELAEVRSSVLEMQASVELILGDVAAAGEASRGAVELMGDNTGTGATIGHALNAAVMHLLGRNEQALASAVSVERKLELLDQAPGPGFFIVIGSVALAMAGGGEYRRARAHLDTALGDTALNTVAFGVENLVVAYGAIAFLAGDVPRCSRLLAWVRSRTFDAGRMMTSASDYATYRHYVTLVRQAVGPDDSRRYQAEGRAMSQVEAIAYAQALETPG